MGVVCRRTQSGIVLRSRLAEDQIRRAVEVGVQQRLPLEAGFDSFSFRQLARVVDLQILGIAHPARQGEERWPRRAKSGCFGSVLSQAIAFEKTSPARGLATSGSVMQKPTFVFCLGATRYLARQAIEKTQRSTLVLSRSSRSCSHVYPNSPGRQRPKRTRANRELTQLTGEHDEPMLSLFEPRHFAGWLHGLWLSGLSQAERDPGPRIVASASVPVGCRPTWLTRT